MNLPVKATATVLCLITACAAAAEGETEEAGELYAGALVPFSRPLSAYWETSEGAQPASRVDITQTMVITQELGPGSALYIDQPSFYPWQLQSRNEDDDNYVFVSTDADELTLVNRMVRRDDQFPSPGTSLLSTVEFDEGTVYPGERMSIHYRNVRLPQQARELSFPLYARVGASGDVVAVEVEPFHILPAPASKVHISAPSLLATNQPFDIRLLVTDRFDNPVAENVPSLEIVIDGNFSRRIPGGSSAKFNVSELVFQDEGLHRIEVSSSGGGIKGVSNLILVRDSLERSLMWGDFHLRDERAGGMFSKEEIQTRLFTELDLPLIVDSNNDGLMLREIKSLLAEGGHLILLDHSRGTIQIPTAQVPVDHRRLLGSLPIVTEILAGHSYHEWYGNQIAQYAYRTGFAATRTSLLAEMGSGRGKTALLVAADGTWLDALAAGSTYAVSGGKPILLWTLNGTTPGSRAAYSRRRSITGEVHASYPLDRVELIKNGQVIDQLLQGSVTGESDRVRIRLTSPSRPKDPPWSLPRSGREWIGYLRVTGARIDGIEATEFRKSELGNIVVNPVDAHRLDFITWTQGGSSSFMLDLTREQQDVSLELHVMAGSTDSPPNTELGSGTPAIRQMLSVDDLREGVWQRSFDADGHRDSVDISLVDRGVSNSLTFGFTDSTDTNQGDYYYLRIRGLADEMIWSSPVFVGGFDAE